MTEIRRGRVEALFLRAAREVVPDEHLATLDAQARKIAFTRLHALQERDIILKALGGAVLLKGSVLEWLVYPDPLLRSTNDLDLLVKRADEGRVHDAMLSLGYEEVDLFPTRAVSRAAYHERLYGKTLIEGRVRQPVEIHFGFAQSFRHAVPYDLAVDRSVAFPEGGPGARRLDDADQLLHLGLHLAREQFLGPLKNLLDVHLWMERGGLDVAELVRRAGQYGAETSLFEALRLSVDLFGTAVPAELMVALAPGRLRGLWLRGQHAPGQGLVKRRKSMRQAQLLALLPLLDTTSQRARFLSAYALQRLADARSRS